MAYNIRERSRVLVSVLGVWGGRFQAAYKKCRDGKGGKVYLTSDLFSLMYQEYVVYVFCMMSNPLYCRIEICTWLY